MILTAVSFLRNDEPQEPYGISCLVDAFNGGNQKGDTIQPYIIDCNKCWNDITGDYDIDWENLADEAATNIIASGCNVAAFSCFAWCSLFCKLVLRKIKGHKNIEKIVLGGPTIVGGLEAMQNEYPQADLFIESYGEKVFANMRKYFSENNKYVIDLPDFSTLQSPYLSGRVVVSKGMTVRMELRRGCCFQCTYCRYKDNTKKIYCIGNTDRWKREVMLRRKWLEGLRLSRMKTEKPTAETTMNASMPRTISSAEPFLEDVRFIVSSSPVWPAPPAEGGRNWATAGRS